MGKQELARVGPGVAAGGSRYTKTEHALDRTMARSGVFDRGGPLQTAYLLPMTTTLKAPRRSVESCSKRMGRFARPLSHICQDFGTMFIGAPSSSSCSVQVSARCTASIAKWASTSFPVCAPFTSWTGGAPYRLLIRLLPRRKSVL